VLFTIFVFGPCEPLIPILMYPAAKGNLFGLVLVTAIFGLVTIMTMLSIVLISSLGVSFLPLGKMERYSHAVAGAVICLCGVAIQFLGL
jgi:sulfite exporter TauE/SafE